jgi:hypothetical protein
MEKRKPIPVLETSLLYNVRLGLHMVTTYYDDGTSDERLLPLSPLLPPPLIFTGGW